MNPSRSSSQSYRWAGSGRGSVTGPKQFAIGWKHSLDIPGLLDMVVGSLRMINGGSLWRADRDPFPRPDLGNDSAAPPRQHTSPHRGGRYKPRADVGPDALELTAGATYTGSDQGSGRLQMEAVVQPSIRGDEIGLVLTFSDQYGGYGLTWTQQVSEIIVAQTVMHIGDSLYFQVTGQQSTANPCDRWTMLMGGWRSGAEFQYGPWWISLA